MNNGLTVSLCLAAYTNSPLLPLKKIKDEQGISSFWKCEC